MDRETYRNANEFFEFYKHNFIVFYFTLFLALKEAICYGVYGCFSIEPPWVGDTERPITYFPESPSKMKVKFPLLNKYNRNTPHYVDVNDPENVKNFRINPNAKLFLIAHGYLESGDRPWVIPVYVKI